jgi:hypothetical protein
LLDIAVVASDVAKWRSAWWRLGCGGLDLTLILVLDFVLGYFCDIVCWTHVCMLEIFLEFLQGSFLFNYLNFNLFISLCRDLQKNSHPSSGRII